MPSQEVPKTKPVVTAAKEEREPLGSDAKVPYSYWGKVLTRIGEIRAPLAGGLASASVQRAGNNFYVKASGFFAKKIMANPDDFAILKGVIAEVEGLSKDAINVEIVSPDSRTSQDGGSELDKIFG